MWLFQAWNRGFVRMLKIFSIGQTTIALPPVYFPFIGPILNRDAFMRSTLADGDRYRLLHQGDLFTTTVRRSTYKSRIGTIKGG